MRRIKQITTLLLICIFAGSLIGCGGRDEEALERELAYRQAGIEKMDHKDYKGAAEQFQLALDQSLAVVDELEIDICYYKALAQYKSGDIQGAEETYQAIINYDEKRVEPWYLRGTMYLESGNVEAGLADYYKAIELAPNNGAMFNKMAEYLLALEMQTQADGILQQGLNAKCATAAEYREKGYTYYLLGEYDNARTYVDKAIQMGDTEGIFYLARIYEALGQIEQAESLYANYVSEHEGDPAILNHLGCNRMEAGDYRKALEYFQTALEANDPLLDQQLRRNEIAALEQLLDFDQAKIKMKSYITDYPDDAEAAREYEFLLSR